MSFLMKNKKGLFVALLVVISAFAIYQFGLKGSTVAAYSVTKQDFLPSLIISGEVIPETSASISTQPGGIVMQCLVKKGEVVKQGQLLVQLDDRQAQINLDRARQTVQMAQLNLQQAATVTMEGMRVTSTQADLDLEQAQIQYARTLTLLEAGAVSEQEMELADSKLKSATEKARSARMALAAFMDDGVNLEILQTELQQRQLEANAQQLILDQYRILAPFDGVVLDLNVGAGELLVAGSKVALMSSNTYARVRIEPDQRYAGLAAIAHKAQVWIPSQGETKWEAQVVFAEPVGNADQGTIKVELSLQNNIAGLYPGQLVSVQLYGDVEQQAIIIPEVYLTVQQGKNGVWIAQNGHAHFIELQVGLQTPDGALIIKGLQAGDILLQPTGLREGQRVIPQTEGSL